jgi:D-alanine-D-alanine ligase
MREPRIGVLLGGLSAERPLSLESGQAVLDALRVRGHDARHVFVDRDLDVVLRHERIDLAFIALRGRYGEDGCVQGLCEVLGVRYTGSGVLASALAMNKVRAKQIFRLCNLPTPPGYAVPADLSPDQLLSRHADFGFPVVVKPVSQGSSLGVSLVDGRDQLVAACARAAGLGDSVLIERHIEGQELSIAVLDDRALGAVEIETSRPFFDHDAKRAAAGDTRYLFPPRLGAERSRGALHLAAMAHRALGCAGVTRVDLIVSQTGNEYLLEVNTAPAMTRQGLLARIAENAGLSFEDLVEAVLGSALGRGAGAPETRMAA